MERITPEAVREATGRDWDGWFAALDAADAAGWDHRALVAHLERAHPELTSGWWRQSVAVAYERARGRRVVGQTADAGFQVGVQRTVPAPSDQVWELLVARPELWLGEGAVLEEGARYAVPEAAGTVRVVRPGVRLRMTWQPEGWAAPATLQVTLTQVRTGTRVGVHLERLPDADAREQQRAHWRAALERLADALGQGAPPGLAVLPPLSPGQTRTRTTS